MYFNMVRTGTETKVPRHKCHIIIFSVKQKKQMNVFSLQSSTFEKNYKYPNIYKLRES